MSLKDERARRTLDIAERVHGLLKDHGLAAALIGAMACAVHGYSRATEDVDLAVYADPVQTLPGVTRALADAGFAVHFERPDPDDPLGGVITVTGGDFDPVQIVNFYNPQATADNPGWDAIQTARTLSIGRALRVVSLPHLIALKLYAGGAKSRLDIIELFERNAPVELGSVRQVCQKFSVGEALEDILRDLHLS